MPPGAYSLARHYHDIRHSPFVHSWQKIFAPFANPLRPLRLKISAFLRDISDDLRETKRVDKKTSQSHPISGT